eukprot:g9630.t1
MEVDQTLNLPLIENKDRKLDEKDIENNGTGIYEDSDHAMGVNMNQQKSFSFMKTIAVIGVLLLVLTLALEIGFGIRWEIIPIVLFCLFGVWFAVTQTQDLFLHRKGTKRMQEVAFWIQQGSNGFFKTQYRSIAIIATLVSGILFLGFLFRPLPKNKFKEVTSLTYAITTTVSFLIGCLCSCIAGYIGLWISINTNLRVAAAAKESYKRSIKVAMQGGIVAAIVVVTLVVSGIVTLLGLFHLLPFKGINVIPSMLVGYGFGASFVALFAQLGGGIFTKAADIGADLVGKIEASLPEDDPRNPAVIADLVGDNVGDCAGRGADLFESIAAEIISAMILGGTLSTEAGIESSGFVLFPLVVHGFDILVSSLGYYTMVKVYLTDNANGDVNDSVETAKGPLEIISRGLIIAGFSSVLTFSFTCYWLLYTRQAPNAWWHFLLCGIYGMAAGFISVLITTYYTSTNYKPVNDIALASKSGHATNIIMGISVGMESTALPIIVVSMAILGSYWTGNNSGLKTLDGSRTGGIFGTAISTMGMLSTAAYILAMDFFGPIADNAGGIVEMSDEPENVRKITDKLDAVGNTTKAATKGYAVCSATLASFLLFAAFKDEVESIVSNNKKLGSIDLFTPEIFISGLLGAMLIYLFTSMTLRAVGDTAAEVVIEVRKQFQENPDILTGKMKPDYTNCVSIVTNASLKKMVKPGSLVVSFPIFVGVLFRLFGSMFGNDDELLGAKAMCSFLMFATCSGVLCSLFLNNAGGAWDNAKKLIETGAFDGKGSDAHKAAITGDTVGDPFKDTSGPSLHVVIKLLATITLVMVPLYVGS